MNDNIKNRLIKKVVIISLLFILVAFLLLIALNAYFPEMLLDRYIEKSRRVAKHISKRIKNVHVLSGRHSMVKKIVSLNFPDEQNIINIVVRDNSGHLTYQNESKGEKTPFSEIIKERNELNLEMQKFRKTRFVSMKSKNGKVAYYRISSPIIRDGKRIGDVFIGISKRRLFNRIRLDKQQVENIIYIGSLILFSILTLSFFISLWLFIKFRKSEEHAQSLKGLAYIGEISGGLAHEIRNPLNIISINLKLLKEKVEDSNPILLNKIGILEKANNNAASVLTKFLDFARFKKANKTNFNLIDEIEYVASMFSAEFEMLGIFFQIKCDDYNIDVFADRDHIHQICINLLRNSVDALEGCSEKKISLQVHRSKKDVIIIFKDTGKGMDEFTLKNIYTPFFSKKEGGSGLGLAVIKRIVDEYNGDIDAFSELDKGAKIEIKLPGVVGE